MKSVTGDGHVSIKKGRVFMLPLFGGLSRFVTAMIPGLDFILRQSDASCAFVIRDGKITTDKILIEGDIISLIGDGSYDLNGSLEFNVRMQFLKQHTLGGMMLQKVTYPISKLFEFRLHGTLKNPQWYPVNFSSDLLKKVGLK